MLDDLTDSQLREQEKQIAEQKRKREHAKWDTELVGRRFRIIRNPTNKIGNTIERFQGDDYVTLEKTLGVGGDDFVYADVVYLHIKQRQDNQLICSGFEVSHGRRDEPYLKIQPVFYSYADFRNYLGSWNHIDGQTKHVDEISKEEYDTALNTAISNFTTEK